MSTLTHQELRATRYFAVGVTSESRGYQRSHAPSLPPTRLACTVGIARYPAKQGHNGNRRVWVVRLTGP